MNIFYEFCYQSVWFLPLMLIITLHTAIKGYVAWFFGDKTAATIGRLSCNPIKNIDLLGTLLIPILVWIVYQLPFGWGRSLPISKKMLAHHHQIVFVSLFGAFSCFLYAMLWMTVQHYLNLANIHLTWWGLDMIYYSIHMSIGYGVLQLIPISPLDAHYVIDMFLPKRFLGLYRKFSKLGLLLVFILILSRRLDWIMLDAVPEIKYLLEIILVKFLWF